MYPDDIEEVFRMDKKKSSISQHTGIISGGEAGRQAVGSREKLNIGKARQGKARQGKQL